MLHELATAGPIFWGIVIVIALGAMGEWHFAQAII
jgi:hypothetical protein